MFGQTNYELEVKDPYLGVMSLLEFPLDSTIVNLNLDLEKKTNKITPWAIHTSFKTNIDDPDNVMKDSDWYLYQSYPPIYFSYTESKAIMRFLEANVSFDKIIYSWRNYNIYIRAGYQYQFIDYDIMGIEGWQYQDTDDNGEYELYVTSENSALKVMEYQISHHAPMAGFMIHTEALNPSVSISLNYLFVLISDYDDHVLRSKLSTAEGIGHGLLCSIQGIYKLGHQLGPFTPSIILSADFSYVYADIDQTQEWYGNLDSVPEGTKYTGISHIINSTSFLSTIGISLSY